MGIQITTPPAVEPITILALNGETGLKKHVNEAVDVTDSDGLLTSYCQAAWDYAESYTWRSLITRSLRLTLPYWRTCVVLPRPQILSVVSVEYYDDANVLTTLNAADWTIDLNQSVPELHVLDFPATYERLDAVRINYTAGYGTTASAFPPCLLHAVRLLVACAFSTRESTARERTTAECLLDTISLSDDPRLAEFE